MSIQKPFTLSFLTFVLLLSGCAAPMGASRSPSKTDAYLQMEGNALSLRKPSSDTVSLMHRYDLDQLFAKAPEKAVRELHLKAVETGERDLLFALSEMSYLAAEKIRRSVKPWDERDPRDFYLGAAFYAYLYLFSDADAPPPTAFDRRFRTACDLYNFSLGLALTGPKSTNGVVQLEAGRRRLPIGELEIKLDSSSFPWPLENFEKFILGDQYLVYGLSVRNRQPGLGAPLIAVPAKSVGIGIRTMSPSTAFLRFEGALDTLSEAISPASLELHSAFGEGTVQIDDQEVPLETDFSVHMAYALNQSFVWKIEGAQFLSLEEVVPTGVYLSQPYERGRIPVVFVHGTFSSPIWWAEMLNTLRADPELRQKYQFWYFIYNSSAPVLLSAARLRESLQEQITKLDPDGTDEALKQMVVIGHSQGGLLTKLSVTETGDRLWHCLSAKTVEEMDLTEKQEKQVHRLLFVKPLPFVRRVVFIATPHRGSYRAAGLVQSLSRRLVSIPTSLADRARDLGGLITKLKLPKEISRTKITSIDGMSPKNPVLGTLAEIPVAPDVKAHSIIPVKGSGDFHFLSDGIVKYESAHLDDVDSELIVRHSHSCQSTPAVIEEVRRILHVHLDAQEAPAPTLIRAETQSTQQ